MRTLIFVVFLLASLSGWHGCSAQNTNREDVCSSDGEGACLTDGVGMVQTKMKPSQNMNNDKHNEEAIGKTNGDDVRRRRTLTDTIPDAVETYVLYDTEAQAQKAQDATPPFDKTVTKMGLNAGDGKMVTLEILAMFAPGSKHLHKNLGAKWLYNYQIVPRDTQIEFLNQYQVEFVPMLGFRKVAMLSNTWMPEEWGKWLCQKSSCKGYALAPWDMVPEAFYKECDDKHKCNGETKATNKALHMTPEQVKDLTKKVIDKLDVKPKFFMGMNEPEDYHLPHKNYSPEEAEYMWSMYVQTVGTGLNLTLVSPTINTPGWGGWTGDWFASFLRACYKSKDRAEYQCSIELIGRISVHYYTCQASEWAEEYAYPSGAFYQNVATELGTDIHSKEWWLEFLGARPLWVTEFNCNNDNVKGNYCQSGLHEGCTLNTLASHQEQCERITGAAPPSQRFGVYEKKYTIWDEGVIRWLENAANVERWAWWTTFGGTAAGIAAERQAAASFVNPTNPGVESSIKAGDGTSVEIKEKARAILMGTDIGGSCDFSHCPLSPCLEYPTQPWKQTCQEKKTECKGCPQCAGLV